LPRKEGHGTENARPAATLPAVFLFSFPGHPKYKREIMKWNSIMAAACAAAVSLTGYAGAANIIVGSGPDVSYYVLESPNIGSRTYEVYYTYDAFAPLDGWALLQIVNSGDS